jgi:hypothetical protein
VRIAIKVKRYDEAKVLTTRLDGFSIDFPKMETLASEALLFSGSKFKVGSRETLNLKP